MAATGRRRTAIRPPLSLAVTPGQLRGAHRKLGITRRAELADVLRGDVR